MIGRQIGRYRIDARIGEGGMGVVYRGTQVTLDRAVAIKMLAAHAADAENRERFRREALTLARLDHPNIVRIHDVEEEEGSSFIVMEFVGGGSLGDLLGSAGALPPSRAVSIVAPVLSALQAAHLAGVVHRDIKPDNILFTDSGQPKLTDFGIAHMRGGASRTRTGVMMGTPYYMSPEQALGRPVTPAADLYAVGVVLYEMLSGRVPFTGEDPVSVALQHVQGELVPLVDVRPDLPGPLCEIVHRAMARDPQRRFSSAASMQDALEGGGWVPRRGTLDRGPAVVVMGAADPTGSGTGVVADGPRHTGGGSTGATGVTGTGSIHSTGGGAGGGGNGGHSPGASSPRLPVPVPAPVADLGRVARSGAFEVGRALAAPGWKGFPAAFWVGAAVLVLALSVPLLGGLGGGGSDEGPTEAMHVPSGDLQRMADPAGSGTTPSSVTSAGPSGGEGSPAGGLPGGGGGSASGVSAAEILRGGTQTRALTPEESRALEALSRGGARETPGNEGSPALGERSTTPPEGASRAPETSGGGGGTASSPPERFDEAAARRDIEALVERQRRALEARNRELFLREVHASRRAEAGVLFDGVVAPFSAIRSEIGRVEVYLDGPDQAAVGYDVRMTLTLREDGRQVVVSDQENWVLLHEGGRWWIFDW